MTDVAEIARGIAERCEAASGPDRELDADIARAIGSEHGRKSGWSNAENGDYWIIDECAARYSASIDAALTLVPPGVIWAIDFMATPRTVARVRAFNQGSAVTPALALCAAAVRAYLASQS